MNMPANTQFPAGNMHYNMPATYTSPVMPGNTQVPNVIPQFPMVAPYTTPSLDAAKSKEAISVSQSATTPLLPSSYLPRTDQNVVITTSSIGTSVPMYSPQQTVPMYSPQQVPTSIPTFPQQPPIGAQHPQVNVQYSQPQPPVSVPYSQQTTISFPQYSATTPAATMNYPLSQSK